MTCERSPTATGRQRSAASSNIGPSAITVSGPRRPCRRPRRCWHTLARLGVAGLTITNAVRISPITSKSATDWIAPHVRSPVGDLFADLGRAFEALDISWYLFGAQAAIVYGVAPQTADVTVRAPAMATASSPDVGEQAPTSVRPALASSAVAASP